MPRTGSRARAVVLAVVAAAVMALAVGIASGASATGGATSNAQASKAAVIAELEKANQQQIANAPKGVKPDAQQAHALASQPCQAVGWDDGISATRESMLAPGTADVTTVWAATFGGDHYAVYAGSAYSDAGSGVVVVSQFNLCAKHLSDASYSAPAPLGQLSIVSVSGHVLTLRDDSGASVTFDVDARTFG